jgi:Na+-driven multidrug efflux pump
MGDFSDDAIAGYAVIGRMVPVLFCLIFSLSGAVGPIIGQNFGAHQFDRVRQTLRQAMLFAFFYTLAIWPLILILSDPIADLFKLGPEGRELFWLFALVFTPLFFFNGMLFISNAACNNLGRPSWSMWTNWGRNIVGTLPFVWLGSEYFGASGVLLGPAVGGIMFGIGAFWLSRNLVGKLQYNSAGPTSRSTLVQHN